MVDHSHGRQEQHSWSKGEIPENSSIIWLPGWCSSASPMRLLKSAAATNIKSLRFELLNKLNTAANARSMNIIANALAVTNLEDAPRLAINGTSVYDASICAARSMIGIVSFSFSDMVKSLKTFLFASVEFPQWIGGKILTGNHGFLPWNVGVSCKLSHHPMMLI